MLEAHELPGCQRGEGLTAHARGRSRIPRVSNNGKTYDFNVKAGFTKFSNGQAVTAANFKAAIDRDADPKMQSPSVPFFSDIVGASKSPVTGVKVHGSHLVINLTKAAPDFLARMAMPFFCAVPTNLAHDPNGVLAPPSAGPYYISDRQPNKSITIKKNPYYKGKRPHNVNQIVYNIGNSLAATYLRTQQAATDYAAQGIPPASYAEAAQKYGVNKGQFWVKPQLGVNYLAFNHDRALFKGAKGTALAKAINYAIDRKAMLAQGGYLAGKRTDQILPPGLAGFRDANLYPLKGPDLTTAKKWAGEGRHQGRHDGRVLHLEHGLGSARRADRAVQPEADRPEREQPPVRPCRADRQGRHSWRAVRHHVGRLDRRLRRSVRLHQRAAVRRQPPRCEQQQRGVLQRPGVQQADDAPPRCCRALLATTAYGNLDVSMMSKNPPWAARNNFNDRILLSKRVGCFTYNSTYSVDLAALCLK